VKPILVALLLGSNGLLARGQLASLNDQAKCAQQAERAYRTEARSFRSYNPEADVTFTSHYNPKLGSCFVEISESTDAESRLKVRNAFEGATLASFTKQLDPVNPVEPKFLYCDVDGKTCHSETEFDELVIAQFGIRP
jgi:hypothetical protein